MLADFYTHCVCVFGDEGVIALGLNNIFVLCKTWKQELWFSQRCKMPKGVYINQANHKNITVLPVIRSDYIIFIIYVILFDVIQKLILDSESFMMHTEGLERVCGCM